MSRQRELGAEGKGGEEEEENRTGLVVVVWYDVLVEGGSTQLPEYRWGETETGRKTLETVIYYRTAFSANSNFFFTPRFLTDRVQQLHYTRSEDAPALAV